MEGKQKMVGGSKNDEVLKVSADEAGKTHIWGLVLSFVDSMVLKCAVELRIPDIIHSHACPIALSQIATCIDSPSPDLAYLRRIMRFLVHNNIFTASTAPPPSTETLYGLTPSSKWLLRDADLTLAPMLLSENHPSFMAPWHCFAACVKEGGVGFDKAYGRSIWDFASENPEFNHLFNDGMLCMTKIEMAMAVAAYQDGFRSITTLVDVGGATGGAMAAVVEAYPHINAINFDLPHVVASAPPYEGVSHVGGDMFHSIPPADAIFLKWVLHNWNDEDCIKILKNCRKSLPEKTGKIIIMDGVIRENGGGGHDDRVHKLRLVYDLAMITFSSNGRERTEAEWKKVLEEGGFPCYRIIDMGISALSSIIEAYPTAI